MSFYVGVWAASVVLVLSACSSSPSQSSNAQMCLNSTGKCPACEPLGCTLETCTFTADADKTCEPSKCDQTASTICQAAGSGMCASVCVNPNAKFASACQTLRRTCGLTP